MLVNCKNGVRSMEIHRSLGVTEKTAWFMLQRLREACMTARWFYAEARWSGYANSKPTIPSSAERLKNMHKDRKLRMVKQGGMHGGKTVVQGIFYREPRQVRAHVVPDMKRETLQNAVLSNVKYGSRSTPMMQSATTSSAFALCMTL